jgi:hypothetical protein
MIPNRYVSRLVALCIVLLTATAAAGQPVVVPAADGPSSWWLRPQRMVQTNLREIDARMDPGAYVAALKDVRANVVLLNTGGIVANYPTDLPYHYRNPFMQGDFIGDVVERLHAEGIRVIARFDFSKINEEIARQHPEWLSRDRQGAPFPAYNRQVPTCLNGGYQQKAKFEILGEAIDRYPLDGVFFNMIGYPRTDYSGRQLGICQCDGCRNRFREMSGLELPSRAASDDAYRQYERFCSETVQEQFERVNRLIKDRNPDLAICTYTAAGVDVIRSESNTPHGQWTYEDSEKARRVLLEQPGKMLSNAAVHFIHYPQRHASVSPHLTRRRLVQQMVNGAWLDFYCIGPLHQQEDRLGLDEVRDVFRFHADNERWLVDTLPQADAGLALLGGRLADEYRGLFKILSEAHVSFDLVSLERSELSRYPTMVVPVADPLSPPVVQRLDRYVRDGGRLLLTGPVPESLPCAGAGRREVVQRAQGTYIRIRAEDRQRLNSPVLDKLDLVFLDGDLWTYEVVDDVEELLRFIPPAMFGPPEKCYYTEVSDRPCLYYRKCGRGAVAWLPWHVGAHYERQGHAGHAALVRGAIDGLLRSPRRLRLEAPSLVEVNHRVGRSGRFEWVSLINLSGQLEKVLHEPLPVRDVTIELQPQGTVNAVRLLHAGTSLEFTREKGRLRCTVPELKSYEIVLFDE